MQPSKHRFHTHERTRRKPMAGFGASRIRFDVFNLFNANTNDIAYYYTSRLPGEPHEGVNDIHFHPMESRSFRLGPLYNF